MEFAFDQAERSLQAQELVDGEITAVIGGRLLSLLNGHSIAELSRIGEGEVNRMTKDEWPASTITRRGKSVVCGEEGYAIGFCVSASESPKEMTGGMMLPRMLVNSMHAREELGRITTPISAGRTRGRAAPIFCV